MHKGTTFPIATLAAYTHTFVPEQRVKADRTLPLVAFIVSAVTTLIGLAVDVTPAALFGGLLALASVAWWASIQDRVTPAVHKLTVITASGASCTIEGVETAIDVVHEALDQAVDRMTSQPS